MWDIPKKQRQAIAQYLSEIEQQYADRNSSIKIAYATGVFNQREISVHFHLHPSTVGYCCKERLIFAIRDLTPATIEQLLRLTS